MDSSAQTSVTLRERAREFVERPWVTNAVLGVIIFNAVTLGLGTSDTVNAHAGGLLNIIDRVVLGIFVAELALKLFAYGLRFFTSAWNIFDFLVVSVGLLPYSQGLSALRGLRVVRALRLLCSLIAELPYSTIICLIEKHLEAGVIINNICCPLSMVSALCESRERFDLPV